MLSLASRLVFPLPPGERCYSHVVDLLRGFAAIAIVVVHYQHFYFAPGSLTELDQVGRATEPLYPLLWTMYDYGQWAVQLFWGISGFVFANVYAGKITGARALFVRRLARLYPLHLFTLLIVAGLQLAILGTFGTFLLIDNNDLYHFGLQLLFISYWGFQEGHSFNAPIWSVSVELVSYALFWVLLPRLFRWGFIGPMLLVLAARGLLLMNLDNAGMIFILYCMMYFFMGAGINHAVHVLGEQRWLIALAASGALAVFVAAGPVLMLDSAIVAPVMIVAALLSAATLELYCAGPLAAKLRVIGDSTYGVYLWHLPIQLIIVVVLDGLIGSRAIVASPWLLLFYVASACLAGWLSYRYFEQRAGRFVLRRLLPEPQSLAPPC